MGGIYSCYFTIYHRESYRVFRFFVVVVDRYPFVVTMTGAIFNYLDWIPNARILLYTIGMVYMVLRFSILRIVLWLPIFVAFFSGYCILNKYGTGATNVIVSIAAAILSYFIVIRFSGKSPGMPK
jgi:hypothetical protein